MRRTKNRKTKTEKIWSNLPVFVVFARWWWAKVRRCSLWVVAAAWLELLWLYGRWFGSFALSVQRASWNRATVYFTALNVCWDANIRSTSTVARLHRNRRASLLLQRSKFLLLFRPECATRRSQGLDCSSVTWFANFICRRYCWVVGWAELYTLPAQLSYVLLGADEVSVVCARVHRVSHGRIVLFSVVIY